MPEHISPEYTLFIMLYGGAAVMAVVLCLYLLLRRANAIAPDIVPPVRLRRWAAAFFGVAALGHIWWFFFFILSGDAHSWGYAICVVLDCVLLLTTVFGTMLSMLQDRKRPLWPLVVAMVPIVILGGLQIGWPDNDFLTLVIIYMLTLFVFFTIYISVAVRQYGKWLRDNYADLEHKEVWMSLTMLIMFLLLVVIYGFTPDGPSVFFLRIVNFVFFGLLLWRVETLPQLEGVAKHEEDNLPGSEQSQETGVEPQGRATDTLAQKAHLIPSNIGQLLEENCVNAGLYLQHDLTLTQLSAAVGVNRYYLGLYFSTQGQNYNAYINGLRINHFVSLCQEAVEAQRPFSVKQLASESGYRSYSTFYAAFKQRMGQSVTVWMRGMEVSPEQKCS